MSESNNIVPLRPEDTSKLIQEAALRGEKRLIAIDFTNVIADNPDLWVNFIMLAQDFGHSVVLYKTRSNDNMDRELQGCAAAARCEYVLLPDVSMYHHDNANRIALEAFKTKPDIFIDSRSLIW